MVKTNRELRKVLDTHLCYVLCKSGIHSNQYKVDGTTFNIPLPLLRHVEELALKAGKETVADNASEAYCMGILSGTGILEYEDERID